MNLYYLLFFIIGFLVAQYILPFVDSVMNIVMTKLEIPKGKYTLQVTQLNDLINNYSSDSSPQCIGFALNDPEPEEDAE